MQEEKGVSGRKEKGSGVNGKEALSVKRQGGGKEISSKVVKENWNGSDVDWIVVAINK